MRRLSDTTKSDRYWRVSTYANVQPEEIGRIYGADDRVRAVGFDGADLGSWDNLDLAEAAIHLYRAGAWTPLKR